MKKKQPPCTEIAGEIWKPISGFSHYGVSDLGRVRSSARGDLRLMLGLIDRDGYMKLSLSSDEGKVVTFKRSILVAATFLGPRPDGLEVAHDNGDSSDDRAANLIYKTPKANIADKRRHGTLLLGEKCNRSKLMPEQVIEIYTSHQSHRTLADRFGVAESNIWAIKTDRIWKHVTAGLRAAYGK